jgi:Spy/CpxP family protein refolding chaperone
MKHLKTAAFALGAVLLAAPTMGFAQENATPPASNDQATTQAMGNRGHMRQADPAKRLEWMSKKLNLTDDQKAKLQPIFQDEFQQMKAVRDDASLSREQRHEKMMQIRQTFHPQVTAVLTPEQQQKLEQMKQERASRRGGKGAPANPDNSTPQPK